MEHRTDAELARLAYGRASTERERHQARDAALELERRRRARADTDTDSDTDSDTTDPDTAHAPASEPPPPAPRTWRSRRRALAIIVTAALSLVAIGLIAQALTPRPSLEIFERPATEAERALEERLDTFDPDTSTRIIGSVDDSTFFASLTSTTETATDTLICIGVAEFGAITIIECLPVAEFEAQGVDTEIPLSPETGGIRIGDGFRYTWGPTGGFEVERLPAIG